MTSPAHMSVLWPDAAIERLTVDYDAVVLQIREATGTVKRVRCEGHIGLSLNGFWDEVIIEGADVLTSHPAIDRAVASITQRLGATWLDSGNEQRGSSAGEQCRTAAAGSGRG